MIYIVDTQPDQDRTWVLILGTADWDQAIATNQHYIARILAQRNSTKVTFVESLALRRPQVSKRDAQRILKRLARGVRPRLSQNKVYSRRRPPGLQITSPLILPFHRGFGSLINRVLLRRAVRDWTRYQGPKVLWCYTPTAYRLEKGTAAAVYHCVDLLREVPRIDPGVIDRSERKLARSGFTAVATSRAVQANLAEHGFSQSHFWPNVADTAVFRTMDERTGERETKRVVFAGNLSPTKIDYEILIDLAAAGFDVCLAGPRAEGGGDDAQQFARLVEAGIKYVGMLEPHELASLFSTATVGIIPYVINDYTRGVSPLKTFEYLAAGLAVVSTPLGSVKPVEDHVAVVDRSVFIQAVRNLAIVPVDRTLAERQELADANSWTRRALEVNALLDSLLARAMDGAPEENA